MGPNYSISTACATANYAFVSGEGKQPSKMAAYQAQPDYVHHGSRLQERLLVCGPAIAAANHIRNGDADVMIAGGSEAPIIPVGLGGFVACRWGCRHAMGGKLGL